MSIRTAIFLVLFLVCTVGALPIPLLGVLGYVAHYSIGPERQWWAEPVASLGIRYSLALAVMTGIGIILNRRSLRYGSSFLQRQEWLLLLFVAGVGLSLLIGEPSDQDWGEADHPAIKMLKMAVFALMLTHVVTSERSFATLLWVFVAATLVLGLQAYATPREAFEGGRLETVGGSDFRESNVLPAFLAAMLPLIGIQFLRSGWLGKAVCLASGVFAVNAIVLCRSRGSLVGLAAGVAAATIFAPKKFRVVILAGLVVALIGAYRLTDEGFWGRAATIGAEQQDSSAQGRLETWTASIPLLSDHPFGVGVGNFSQVIGQYDPKYIGRDAHSTFVRCYSELGLQGMALFLLLIVNAVVTLWKASRRSLRLAPGGHSTLTYFCYASAVSLVTVLGCGVTVTLLYVEVLWWFLVLPVCLERAVENAELDLAKRGSLAPRNT
jgi:putative inorganic carbon (hco3(-)) transporter